MTDKRHLTKAEIKDILSIVKPQQRIPEDIAQNIVQKFIANMKPTLERITIYPKMIKTLKSEIEKYYEKSKIQPGEAIGVSVAHSIGQYQTQSTLNTFHKAGLAEETLVSGVPRFLQLIDAAKFPKGAMCNIYFRDDIKTLEKAQNLGKDVVYIKLEDLIDEFDKCPYKEYDYWYDNFAKFYGYNFKQFDHCISIKLNLQKLFNYNITLPEIARVLEEQKSDISCVFSPIYEGKIDIFIDSQSINVDENVKYINEDNIIDTYLDFVTPILLNVKIRGVENIANVFYFKDKKDKWYMETKGSNFRDIMALPFVDTTTTMTNNMWEIYNTLGIEALRQFLIQEFSSIVGGVNSCHIKLLADKMTYNGKIDPVSRYTIRSENAGALSKSSFEEPLDNILKSAVNSDVEHTNSVSTSIMCARMAPIGTGLVDLQLDIEKLIEIGESKVFKGDVYEHVFE